MNNIERYTENDINNMKIWVFYLAGKKWKMDPKACNELFERYHLFDCIHDGYDYLHLMSYKCVVDELEEIIQSRNGEKEDEIWCTTRNEDRLREYGAVTLLQRTLEKYAKRKHITLEEALKIFVDTPLYEGLFDYEGTALWKEGPDYLLNMLDGFCEKSSTTF